MTEQTQPTTPTIRVLVVDDQRLMRDGIASLLGLQPGINVIGTAANGQEALDQAQALLPDVILMDVQMPLMDGVAATFAVRQVLPACQILMLTTFDDEAYVIDALQAGACGYLLKDMPASDLAQAIQAAHRGIYQLDPAVASKVIASLAAANRAGPMDARPAPDSATNPTVLPRPQSDLTSRELAVLRLIATGATNREIADRLVISEGTVKNHISNILSRLQLRDRTQAAVYAREAGLL
jgi:DNA-binding NarL/FixJ family response regulator